MRNYRIYFIIATLVFVASFVLLIPRTEVYRDWRNKPSVFDETKWGFQLDTPWFPLPEFNDSEVESAPHHWKGPGHETFATLYATREASLHDPYFLAAQQLIYRVLWSPTSRSKKHPFTVFVAPFVSQEHRAYFTAAGAIVREVALHPFVPTKSGGAGRLKDMFSKLEMWRELEYSRITYLDSDAFPLVNVDDIFDIAQEQTCRKELLPPEDQANVSAICQYTLCGYPDLGGVNAGVLVFNPNVPMYERLIRESLNQTAYDNGFMEQALLQLAYNIDGPFPPSPLPHSYNGGVDTKLQGKPLYIVHHKLWATLLDPDDAWWKDEFNNTWNEMLDYYKSNEFKAARLEDGKNSKVS